MGAEPSFDALSLQLRCADDRTLLKIVSVVDRLAQRGSLDQLLAEHRLRLAVIRPPRPITVGRLFVLPFEELLIDPRHWGAGLMRVPRDRLARLIARTFECLPEGFERDVRQRLEGRTMDDAALLLELGRELWPACLEAVRRTVERSRHARDADSRDLLLPLRIAETLLPVAEAVVSTVWTLPPRPMLELDVNARAKIADLLGRAAGVGKDCFQLVAELLVNRTELPFVIVEAVLSGDFTWGTRERQQAAARIAEACQSDMARLYRALVDAPQTAEPLDLLETLQAIVSNLDSLQEAASEVRFDHRALRRLRADTFALLEAKLTVALEQRVLAGVQSLEERTDPLEWRRLEQNAVAVANMRLMAGRIGLATRIDYLFAQAFERFRECLLAPTHAHPSPSCSTAPAMPTALAMDRLRIVEMVFGSRAAMQLFGELRRATAVSSKSCRPPARHSPTS